MDEVRDVGVLLKFAPTILLFILLVNVSYAYTGTYDKPALAQEFANVVGAAIQFCIDFWYIIISALAVLYAAKYIPDIGMKS